MSNCKMSLMVLCVGSATFVHSASARGQGDEFFDQTEKVIPHPRNSHELEAVSRLMKRQPEPELTRLELMPALEGQDVGGHQEHDITVIVGRKNQLILT